MSFTYRAITVFGRTFQKRSAKQEVCNSPTELQSRPIDPYNPHCATLAGFNTKQVWALSLSLAATQEIEVSFSS